MDNFNEITKTAWREYGYALFAAIGGMIGYLMSTTEITIAKTLINGAASAFVGQIVFMLCNIAKINYDWTGVIVGMSALLGAKTAMSLIELVIFKRLGIRNRRSYDKIINKNKE